MDYDSLTPVGGRLATTYTADSRLQVSSVAAPRRRTTLDNPMPRLSSLRLIGEAAKVWFERNAFQHASALAFYTLFSLAPLMIILVAIVGTLYGEEAASGEIYAQISHLLGNQAAAAVEDAVRRSRPAEAGFLPTLLGLGALLFGATTVFAQMQSSLNQFWGVRPKPERSGILSFFIVRLLSLGLVLILGFLLLVSFAISIAIAGVIEYAGHWIVVPSLLVAAVDLALSVLVATAVFSLLFKILPDVRLEWSDVWRGALFTAILFVAGQYLITMYLTRVAPESTYGAAGALVLVLLWVYFSSLILYFGTAMTKVAIVHRDGVVVPTVAAVRERGPDGPTSM
jgi:membrane protein